MRPINKGNPRGFIDYNHRLINTTTVDGNKHPRIPRWWESKNVEKRDPLLAYEKDKAEHGHPAILLKHNRLCCLSIDNGKTLPKEIKLRKATWRIKTPKGTHYLYDICSSALAALWDKNLRIVISEGVEFWFGNNYIIAPSDFSDLFEHKWEGTMIKNSCRANKVPWDLIGYILEKEGVKDKYLDFMGDKPNPRDFLASVDEGYNF